MIVADSAPAVPSTAPSTVVVADHERRVASRYDARPGDVYLVRPDQHVCARWRYGTPGVVRAALARATCNDRV